MSKTVGRLEFLVDADGKGLAAKVKAIGNRAGAAAGNEFSKSFENTFSKLGNELGKDMRDHGDLAGINFTDSMQRAISGRLNGIADELANVFSNPGGLDEYASGFDSVDEAVTKLRGDMKSLNEAGGLNDKMWNRLGGTLNQWLGSARETETATKDQERALAGLKESLYNSAQAHESFGEAQDRAAANMKKAEAEIKRVSDEHDRLSESTEKSTRSTDRSTSAFARNTGGMSTNAKQIALIIGAIAAGGSDIAAFGSAAGSSLVVLGGAIAVVGTAVAVAVAGFQGMTGPLEEIAEPARAAAEQFGFIQTALSGLQDVIQSAMFQSLAEPLAAVAAALPQLDVGLSAVAAAVGGVLGSMAVAFSSTENIALLNSLFTGMAPIITSLGAAVQSFGGALGIIFQAALPSIQMFADFLADVGARFAEFLASTEGQTALADFFGTLQTIMPAVMTLVEAVGQALADLVTPESVARAVEFLDTMSEFMPILSDVLDTIGQFDLFGLAADLLLALGQAIQPILPALGEMGALLSGTLSEAFATLSPLIGDVLVALMPLVEAIIELGVGILEGLLPMLPELVDALLQLIPPIVELVLALIPLIPQFQEVGQEIINVVVVAILALAPLLPPLIDSFLLLLDQITPLLPVLALLIHAAIVPLTLSAEVLIPIIITVIDIFNQVLGVILPLINPINQTEKALDDVGISFDDLTGFIDGAISGIQDFGGTVSDVMGGVIDAVAGAIGWFQDLMNAASGAAGVSPSQGGGSGGNAPQGFGFAAGGVAKRPTRGVFGEAGTEALVPLDRPLSEIDPSVRGLAAIAQGKGGTGVNIAAGAIVVNSKYGNPALVAAEVLDAIVTDAQ